MWRDATWLLDMLLVGRKTLEYAKGLTQDRFMESGFHQDAIVRQLTIVGEAAKRVSAEFRAAHPEIPWKRIAGFRDIVIHDYFRVNLQEVCRKVNLVSRRAIDRSQNWIRREEILSSARVVYASR